MVEVKHFGKSKDKKSAFRWWIGMAMASTFSLVYFAAPMYIVTAILAVAFRFPCWHAALIYASPIFVSALFKPISTPWLLGMLAPMLDYFEYEQIVELSPINVTQEIMGGTNYLCICQPHGVFSYVGVVAAVAADDFYRANLQTAVADALMYTPILKHFIGIFGIVSASKKNLQRILRKKGIKGTVVLYVGGMAELFLSCEKEEILYLKKRKGFIKLALQEGVDIIPIYLFGNTSVLSVLKMGLLAKTSRKLQVSITYFWGKWGLPIPRDCKLLYVGGQPLGLPHIVSPTQEDIDKWHAKYCNEVTRIFETYKERVPEYKHKKLSIV